MNVLLLVERVLLCIAGAALLAMMGVMSMDAFGRYFLSAPVTAAFEIVELLMAMLVCAAVPVVTLRKKHIVVDLFEDFFPSALRSALSVLMPLVCLAVALGFSWVLWRRGIFLGRGGEMTLGLGLPQAWIAYTMSLAWLLCALAFLYVVFSILLRRPPGTQGR